MTIAVLLALLLVLCAALLFVWLRERRTNRTLDEISDALHDIENGYARRKLLTDPGERASRVCFQLNRIIDSYNDRLSRIEKQERNYRKLLAGLSHDLRTPLASLTGYLEAVEQNYVPETRKSEYLSVARKKSQDLKQQIDLLFEWFKLDAGERIFVFAPTDINELAREAAASFIPIWEQRGISYEIDIPDQERFICADESACGRIIGNLLQNAVTHSRGTKIIMRVADDGRAVTLQVGDNGMGISEKDLPFVFDRLYSRSKAPSGENSGLGLSITKMLAEAHGGSVSLESAENSGALFTVTLPVNGPEVRGS